MRHDPDVWLSVHLHVPEASSTLLDVVLIEFVQPLIQSLSADGLLARCFFIRYGEGGPHIRLRMVATERASQAALQTRVEVAATAWSDRSPANLHVQPLWVRYEPEYERYGGTGSMSVIEDFFCDSSRACLEFVERLLHEHDARDARFGTNMLMNLALVRAFYDVPQEAAALLISYGQAYALMLAGPESVKALSQSFDAAYEQQAHHLRAFAGAAWGQCGADDDPGSTLATYSYAAKRCTDALRLLQREQQIDVRGMRSAEWDSARRFLLPSLLHMTSNRLGLSMVEESYVAVLSGRALGELAIAE